ncbi:MAG TPA: 30S ribosome-binding factor RbfA [Candidatus Dormibacteraeota bacterium]
MRSGAGSAARHAGIGRGSRLDRVAEQLRQELSSLMVTEMKDERVRFATVSKVDASPDLRSARVLVSASGSDTERHAVIVALRHAEGYLRGELGHRLENLKTVPHLHFELDESIAYSVRIGRMLEDLTPPGGWSDESNPAAHLGEATP